MARIHGHIRAGQEDHGNVEILNDLSGGGNTLVENLLTQYIEERDEHDRDQADAGYVRHIFEDLYDHAVHLVIQCAWLTGQ